MKKASILISGLGTTLLVSALILSVLPDSHSELAVVEVDWWEIQSIDTVKFSRDVAREKAQQISYDEVIESQVGMIAGTGATHVAIGTPYDKEFIPFMKRWIESARRNGLNVWFRGNFSGWEGWFDYDRIDRQQHKQQLEDFILDNGELFENGDIFSPCTECENGGPGDPRLINDHEQHRQFLIEEYKIANSSFRNIGKNVRTSFPMNGDVARQIMNKETTRALGGIVVIDHYVSTPERLVNDIKTLSEASGGRIILGEYGVPIPDIHGNLTASEQAELIERSFSALSEIDSLVGVNYWTSFGGSTRLWESDNTKRQVVDVVTKFYTPNTLTGTIRNGIGGAVRGADVTIGPRQATSAESGVFSVPYVDPEKEMIISADGYKDLVFDGEKQETMTFVLEREQESVLFKIIRSLISLFK